MNLKISFVFCWFRNFSHKKNDQKLGIEARSMYPDALFRCHPNSSIPFYYPLTPSTSCQTSTTKYQPASLISLPPHAKEIVRVTKVFTSAMSHALFG
jgi:hypothetical protein